MAYFVTLNNENIVSDIQVISDDILIGIDGNENDQNGIDFLNQMQGFHPKRLRTYKDGSKRNIFASVGCSYDANNDVFILPKPYPSWTLNSDNKWEAPVSPPTDGEVHIWNEENQQWD
tara:strand:+ start:1346 stop:1699 length:354 start_codon:yes stop_codon:yes gene_type:complete